MNYFAIRTDGQTVWYVPFETEFEAELEFYAMQMGTAKKVGYGQKAAKITLRQTVEKVAKEWGIGGAEFVEVNRVKESAQ